MVNDFKKMSNEEFLSYVLNFSKAGPLAHGILIHAIISYTHRISNLSREEFSKRQDFGFFSPEAWYDACVILKDEFEAKYGNLEVKNGK
jgi:hypothetical protein